MFRPGKYYRHDCTLDIDLEVMRVRYVGPKYIRLKVNIVDRAHTGRFQSGAVVKIKRVDFNRWKEVT